MSIPLLVIGDRFVVDASAFALEQQPFSFADADAIKCAVVDANHSAALTEIVDQSSSAEGADWDAGVLVVDIPATVTEQLREHYSEPGIASIEVEVDRPGGEMTAFFAVRVVPGHVS